ncbi:MAG: (d)CMP kinase [Smithellaceae bacterium]
MAVFVDGDNVADKIRSEEIGQKASWISTFPVVREKLLLLQRQAGESENIVAEGRDMGSVVFPNADFKFYLDADPEERILRRHRELLEKNIAAQIDEVTRDMQARDHQDSHRKIAPLKKADDAIPIDSTSLTPGQVVDEIQRYVEAGKESGTGLE